MLQLPIYACICAMRTVYGCSQRSYFCRLTPMMRVRIAATSGAPRKMSTLRATRQKPIWNCESPKYWRDTTCHAVTDALCHEGKFEGLGSDLGLLSASGSGSNSDYNS